MDLMTFSWWIGYKGATRDILGMFWITLWMQDLFLLFHWGVPISPNKITATNIPSYSKVDFSTVRNLCKAQYVSVFDESSFARYVHTLLRTSGVMLDKYYGLEVPGLALLLRILYL